MATAARFVRHSRRPEWGVGRLVSEPEAGAPFRYAFADGEVRAFVEQSLTLLSPLDPFEVARAEAEAKAAEAEAKAGEAARAAAARKQARARGEAVRAATLEQQMANFVARYPGGFDDPKYVEDERGVPGTRKAGRQGSVLMARDELGVDALREVLLGGRGGGTFALLRKVAQRSRGLLVADDLLVVSALVGDALTEQRLCETLFDLVHGKGPIDERFETFARVMPPAAATWPLCTLAAALFDAERQLFVHPAVTFWQSAMVGGPARGAGRPSGEVYRGLVAAAGKVAESLTAASLRPRDLLDVHAFSCCSQFAPAPQARRGGA